MYGDTSDLEQVKQRLNSVSPSFCMAKWKHVTLHLLNGRTHSCYLPQTHAIPLKEIEENPAALHNTSYKKEQRKLMLEGKRPAECGMCWAIEDLPQAHVSDRILRGSESWTIPYFDEVKSLPWNADVTPSYMEVSFSSICNFKCSYCSPHVSSRWMDEIRQHGPYKLTERFQDISSLKSSGMMPIEDEEANPYIQAFWKWWPELSQKLRVFRITGGEPLLSKHTFRVLDWIEENPTPHLELDINTNFGVPRRILDPFMEQVERILAEKKVRRLTIHTSLDSWGKQAEYIRHGLVFEDFERNIGDYLSRVHQGQLAFMSTFNALSVVGYPKFLEWITELRTRFNHQGRFIHLDIPHLSGPQHLSIRILTTDYQERIQMMIAEMEKKTGTDRAMPFFRQMEVEKLKRVLDWMRVPQNPKDLNRWRRDFYLYFSEHDRRRGTDFLSTFPEMESFWQTCRSLV